MKGGDRRMKGRSVRASSVVDVARGPSSAVRSARASSSSSTRMRGNTKAPCGAHGSAKHLPHAKNSAYHCLYKLFYLLNSRNAVPLDI